MSDDMTAGNWQQAESVRWCPSCDLPLKRRVNTLSGNVSWWTTFGSPVDVCPRCFGHLPLERPDVALTNVLLAEAGEPETTAEEMERGPWTRRAA